MTLKCNICIYSSLKHVYIPFIKLLFSFSFQVETAAVALLLEGVDTVKHSKMVVALIVILQYNNITVFNL